MAILQFKSGMNTKKTREILHKNRKHELIIAGYPKARVGKGSNIRMVTTKRKQ